MPEAVRQDYARKWNRRDWRSDDDAQKPRVKAVAELLQSPAVARYVRRLPKEVVDAGAASLAGEMANANGSAAAGGGDAMDVS